MFGLGFTEILLVLVIVLIVVGPDRLPELARTLGRSMFQLRNAADELKQEFALPKNAFEREKRKLKKYADEIIESVNEVPENESVEKTPDTKSAKEESDVNSE